MKRFLFILILTFATSLSFAARQDFSPIDGKDYYEILEVERSADAATIKSSFRKLIMKHHPDRNAGDDTKAKQINRAYDVLGEPQLRAQYDRFLGAGGDSGAGSSSSSARSSDGERREYYTNEDELKTDMRSRIVAELHRNLTDMLQQRNLALPEMTEVARMSIVYNQRFFPGAYIDPEQLFLLINQYVLNDQEAQRWSETTLYALAAGAITVLQERIPHPEGHLSAATIENVKRILQARLAGAPRTPRNLFLNRIWELLTGTTYFPPAPPPPPPPPADCGSILTQATVTDQYGRTWTVPVSISISIGESLLLRL